MTDNKFHEYCYTLVSWMTSKTTVVMEIDEGKFIHFQDALDTVDAATGPSGAKAKCWLRTTSLNGLEMWL